MLPARSVFASWLKATPWGQPPWGASVTLTSLRFAEVREQRETSARPSSGVMATLEGGPTTLVGTLPTRPITLRIGPFMSRITMLSGPRLGSTLTAPSVSFGLASLPDTAISAEAMDPDSRTSAYGKIIPRAADASFMATPFVETPA